MNLPTSQILPPEFVSALRAEASKFVASDKDHSLRQWTIGALVEAGEAEYVGRRDQFWAETLDVLRGAAGTWVSFSESNLRRWVRTVRRFENVDIDEYRARLPFEYFAVAGEIMSDGCQKPAREILNWAIVNRGSAEEMREAFRRPGDNAPAWGAWKHSWQNVWGESYAQLPETVRARIDPLRQQIDQIIEESERPNDPQTEAPEMPAL